MFAVQTIRTTTVLLTTVLLLDKCFGYPSIKEKQEITSYCTGCGNFCHKCEYGTVILDACGIEQCAKGPDESCGGPNERYGICAEGMRCNCNRCIGCSLEKFNCSVDQDPCLPHKSSESLDINRFEGWPAAM